MALKHALATSKKNNQTLRLVILCGMLCNKELSRKQVECDRNEKFEMNVTTDKTRVARFRN